MIKAILAIVGISCGLQPALAQMSSPPIPSALPDVSSISLSNAAGALQYCMSKGLVSSTSAGEVLQSLRNQADLSTSPEFAAGASGELLGNKSFAMASAPGYLQSQACDLALNRFKQLP